MKLNELKETIDLYCQKGEGDSNVVIELDQISIGGIASVKVKQIYAGIDWDRGKIIIIAEKPIIEKSKDRDNPVPIKHDPVFPKRFVCTACGGYIHKNDNYCCNCGQKLCGE